jgi:hypothetical protein
MNTRKITFLIFCLSLLFASCKKDSPMDPLSDVVFSKNGVIRVECTDCALNYTVLKDNYAVKIKNSEDIKFRYVSDFQLKTTINSTKKQNIRLAVFDAYGRIVSNELTSFDPGDLKEDTFSIKIN